MKLLTKEIVQSMPALYSQEKNPDPVTVCKFFNPAGSGTWYVLEGRADDTGDCLFFGYVTGLQENELGYFTLKELESVRVRFGLRIERDLHYSPEPISKIKARGF